MKICGEIISISEDENEPQEIIVTVRIRRKSYPIMPSSLFYDEEEYNRKVEEVKKKRKDISNYNKIIDRLHLGEIELEQKD